MVRRSEMDPGILSKRLIQKFVPSAPQTRELQVFGEPWERFRHFKGTILETDSSPQLKLVQR